MLSESAVIVTGFDSTGTPSSVTTAFAVAWNPLVIGSFSTIVLLPGTVWSLVSLRMYSVFAFDRFAFSPVLTVPLIVPTAGCVHLDRAVAQRKLHLFQEGGERHPSSRVHVDVEVVLGPVPGQLRGDSDPCPPRSTG